MRYKSVNKWFGQLIKINLSIFVQVTQKNEHQSNKPREKNIFVLMIIIMIWNDNENIASIYIYTLRLSVRMFKSMMNFP